MIALESSNHIIIALKNKLARFNLENSEITWLLEIENELKGTRANDGKCDAKGRLWLGTMDTNCIENTGSLYQIDSGLTKKKKLTELYISNGLAWSIDNNRMYFIDSATYKADSYLFELETGNIKFEKTAIEIPQNMGMPDGMTIDKEGMLWVAHWNGFAVHRWNPYNGTHLSTIKLPVPKVSSVAFGGKNLDEIFITTAKTGLTDKELLTYPLSGHIFTLKLPITGFPANSFICDPL
jgi:sugar lactone lactonase YvrE